MLKNLLLVAFRNLKRDKWYSLLNILGLAIGITFSLFLIMYILDELSYDKYNRNANRLYRVNSYIKEKDKDTMRWTATPFPVAPALAKDYPEVEEAARMVGAGRTMLKNGTVKFYEDKVFFADSNIFRLFTWPFVEGNEKTALIKPNSIVLTETAAEKYFGKGKSIVGKTLQNEKNEIYTVTGIVKDIPRNSHISFTLLVSRNTLPVDFSNNWGNFSFFNYVLLKPNTNPVLFEKKMLPMYDKYMASIFAQYNIKIRLGIQKVTSIHLHSDMSGEPEELGSMSYIYIFASVALFMLIIACINYMNLTTARSARRAKEIGIRKVTGSNKGMLVAQFLVESVLTAFLGLLLSIGLMALFLPVFNQLSGKTFHLIELLKPDIILILLSIVVFVGLAGGSYPAFYLSGFNPIDTLKGSLSKSSGNVTLRRVLVVLQFSISMIMLICTWIVYGQLKYLRNVDLGFNKQQVMAMVVATDNDVRSKILAFKNEIKTNPQILSLSTSRNTPGSPNMNFNLFSIESKDGFTDKGVDNYAVDEDFVKTLGMKIVAGRNFTGLSDTLRSILVNENMVKNFGWGDKPLGKRLKFPGDTSGRYFEVVGVIKDFNQKSLYNPIAPLVLFYQANSGNILVKVAQDKTAGVLTSVEKAWKNYFPELPFQYTFLDEDIYSQYAADQKRGKIFTAFSVLTILITCLGLLGLIAFITQQRQKEISIRKIMGAGVAQIVPLITRNFVYLVGIACLLAFPVAYLFMHKWLQIFPYNTGLRVTPFILSALSVLLITLLTVIFHTVRAAVANPSKNLRTE